MSLIEPLSMTPLTALDEFRLEVLPVLRLAEFALREPDRVDLRTEARAQLAALLESLRVDMKLTATVAPK